MKKSLFLSALMVPVIAVLLSSCSEKTITRNEYSEATVKISFLSTTDLSQCHVLFTPSENTSMVRYAIGEDGMSDAEAFYNGTMETVDKEGNEPFDITFEGLEQKKEYTVYAVAYDGENMPGSLSTMKVQPTSGLFSLDMTYVMDISAGVTVYMNAGYSYCSYYFGTEADRDKVLNDEVEFGRLESVKGRYTFNYYDLTPDTEYVFYAKAYDVQNIPTEMFEYKFRTLPAAEAPGIECKAARMNAYESELEVTSTGPCSHFTVYVCKQGEEDAKLNSPTNMRGDVISMVQSYETSGVAQTGNGGETLKVKYINADMKPGFDFDVYVLFKDEGNNPVGVKKFTAGGPQLVEDAGVAEVEIKVENITSGGGTYTFTPNDKTMGFWYETVAVSWADNMMSMMPEFYIHEYLMNTKGQYWSYGNDEITYTETGANANTEYYVVACPMNVNGVDGWAPLSKFKFKTLAK